MTSSVPLYDAAGSYQGARSLASINRLIDVDRVTVIRNRKGRIVRAFMRRVDGSPSVLKTVYQGTKYSFREQLPTGHSVFTLKKLGGNNPQNPTYLRPIFLTVLTSCLATRKLSTATLN